MNIAMKPSANIVGVASRTGGNLCQRGGGYAGYAHVQALHDFLEEHVPDLTERLPPLDLPGSDAPPLSP